MSVKGIKFLCTDKGAHRPIELGTTGSFGLLHDRRWGQRDRGAKWRPQYNEDGEWCLNAPPRGESGRRKFKDMTVIAPYVMILRPIRDMMDDPLERRYAHDDGPTGYQLLCPKCGRNPQIGGERFSAALPALMDAGITEVDISLLPF